MLTVVERSTFSRCVGNERGTAIITALLLLVLLTFIALTATDTAIKEKTMVRSEAVFEQNFSFAESAGLEGMQRLENQPKDKLEELLPAKLTGASVNKDLLRDAQSDEPEKIFTVLDTDGDGVIDKDDTLEISELDGETFRAAILLPIAPGDSLSVTGTASRLYTYNTFGLSEGRGGRVMVRMGYKKRIEH